MAHHDAESLSVMICWLMTFHLSADGVIRITCHPSVIQLSPSSSAPIIVFAMATLSIGATKSAYAVKGHSQKRIFSLSTYGSAAKAEDAANVFVRLFKEFT